MHTAAKLRIEAARPDQAEAISHLVRLSFTRLAAADWAPSAAERFLSDMAAERLAVVLAGASFAATCWAEERMVGVMVMPDPSRVDLLFTHPDALRQGVAGALWQAALQHLAEHHPAVRTVALNATPNAVPAYRALGFWPLSHPFEVDGCHAVRMAYWRSPLNPAPNPAASQGMRWARDCAGLTRPALEALFHAAGLGGRDDGRILQAFRQSQRVALLWHGAQLIAAARAISDECYHALVVDVAVWPTWQGQGLGRQAMHHLLADLPVWRVLLRAAPEVQPFYRRLGFEPYGGEMMARLNPDFFKP
ncbi:MAG: GNAT family N-acetyltransferase [Ideonella sp.]|nr:GNAT family N-acetyltransferase [Ideonella sp.]